MLTHRRARGRGQNEVGMGEDKVGSIEREPGGTTTEYYDVDVRGDRIERLLTELFTEHWPRITAGPRATSWPASAAWRGPRSSGPREAPARRRSGGSGSGTGARS